MAIRALAVGMALILLGGCVEIVSPIPEESSYDQVNKHTSISIFPPTSKKIKYSIAGFADTQEYFYLKDSRKSVDEISRKLLGFVPDEYGYKMDSRTRLKRRWWKNEAPPGARGGQLAESPLFLEILIVDHDAYSEMWIFKSRAY